MSVKMSNKSKPNNSVNEAGVSREGLSPGRSPIGEQDGPGHRRTVGDRTTRRKWSQKEKRVVMQCYYKSEYGRNGYRKRMHVIWNEIGMFNVTEQWLVDQKNNILKRKWLSDLELEEIQRNIKDLGNGEVGLESDVDEEWFLGFDLEGQEVFMKECEVVLEDCMVPNVEEERSNVFVIKMNMQITNKDMTILEKMHNVLSKETRERMPPLSGIEKHRLMEATRKVDEVMTKTEVGNITELNDLVYDAAIVVTEMLEVKNRKGTGMEPWWKRRMEAQVKQLNKNLGHINTLTERQNMKQKHKDGLERRDKLKQRGLPVT